MLPGIDGHLLAGAFIRQHLSANGVWTGSEDLLQARRKLAAWRAACATLGPASTPRTILQSAAPLFATLGFEPAERIESADPGVAATLRSRDRAVALLVSPWGDGHESLWRPAVTQAARRSASWCLVFNGLQLRIVDANRLYARRHLEIDLDLALDNPPAFAVLLHLFGASALGSEPGDPRSLHALVSESDRHAAGVCRSLREGVLGASVEILRALVAGRVRRRANATSRASGDGRVSTSAVVADSFEQALTIVYRMLFLLFAEARALVPLWHPIYRESYSIEGLRNAAEQLPPALGLWDALRAIARLAHTGCRAGDLQVTPFNGRLFSPTHTPLAERRDLDDGAARRAVIALSTRSAPDRAGRERIAYRDLGVEQLGAVYETLLDYEPQVDRGSVSLHTGSGVRKATGTFYTPQPIADYLVRRTLGPLVYDAAPDRILQLRIVDPAMGSGAFLVAACRFLAGAYESALVRHGGCHSSDIGESERVSIRRTIAERCLYGVDLNPMAVQLARLSLWLATLAADRPLSFLDHRLQVGDSLLGTWVAHVRQAPSLRRRRGSSDSLPLFDSDAVTSAVQAALPLRFSLESPNDTVEHVRAKERAFAELTGRHASLSRWKQIAHLWCAPWFAPAGTAAPESAFGSLTDAVLTGRSALPPRTSERYLEQAEALAEARRFFHWELEFPEVFFDRNGASRVDAGFDAVIGNPPWDMIRADQGGADTRSRARTHEIPVVRFTRDAGVYTAQSDGHANRYQLFVERAIALTRPGGRMGLVLPSGFATDRGSAALRRLLFSRCSVDALVGMDNRRGVFPIHRGVRFLLVTASKGTPTDRFACRLDVDDPAALESMDEGISSGRLAVYVSPALLERISGPDLAVPNLRCALDLAIVERAASLFPPLSSTRGWGVRFGRELNASDDRESLRPVKDPADLKRAAFLPVIDGKHVEPFRVALDSVRRGISPTEARRLLRSDRHERPRLGYRDVASATNRLTLIATVLPAHCVSTHTVFCLRTPLPSQMHYLLSGFFNSLVVNYLVRLRVTMHVTTATVEQLPIPTTEGAPAACREIAALARLLARRPDRTAFARLNARVAQLYQLSSQEFEHILETFPLIPREERELILDVFLRPRDKERTQRS
jgi:hypothetical protein